MSGGALAPEIEAFAAALDGEPRARVHLERCRELFLAHGADRATGEPDPRRALAGALDLLAAAGRIRLPSRRSKHLWQEERAPALPAHVVRARENEPEAPVLGSLHPVLARARDRARGARLPDGIAEADAWLKARALDGEPVPLAERSHEVFGDEKRLGGFLRTRFALEGGLGPESFGAYPVADPFAMTEVRPGASWAIALENLATYDSVCRAYAREGPTGRPAAVIFGRGNHFTASCLSLPERLRSVRRLVYFGDLDRAGLEIPLAVRALVPSVSVEPWERAYAALLECKPGPSSRKVSPEVAARVTEFLPRELREKVAALLERGSRVPQEAVGRATLATLICQLGESR